MIGPEAPTSYDLDAWRAHVADLQAHDDYPWRQSQIFAAQETIHLIEDSIAETGDPPSALDMLRFRSVP